MNKEKEYKYLLIGDEGINYEINLGKSSELAIMNLEAIIDSIVDTFKGYMGLEVSELIENIKRDALADEDIKEVYEGEGF